MAERPDFPCPATGLDHCPDYCTTACLRLADNVQPYDDEPGRPCPMRPDLLICHVCGPDCRETRP